MTMREIQSGVPEPTHSRQEVKFPAALEGRMEAILASLNSAPKAAVLLLLSESLIDTASLNKAYVDTASGSQMPIKRDMAESYCRDSLCRIGLVSEEVAIDYFGQEKSVGFKLTRAGEIFGLPAAALVLDFETSHNFSVYPVLGQSMLARGEHRAPITRAKTIKSLAKGERRQIDICLELGINHERARSSLIALRNAGVVEYTSFTPQTGENQVSFSINKEDAVEANQVRGKREFTDAVIGAARTLDQQGLPITQAAVFELVQGAGGAATEKNVRTLISQTLTDLADRQHFLTRIQFKGREIYSSIKLTDKGKTIAIEFLAPLEDLLTDTGSETLKRVRDQILSKVLANTQGYAVRGIDLYYPYSRSFSASNQDKVRLTVESVLSRQRGAGITSQQLGKNLKLGELKTRRILLSMIESGKAKRKLRNGVFYYFVR